MHHHRATRGRVADSGGPSKVSAAARRIGRRASRRARAALLTILPAALPVGGGCMSLGGWVNDYVEAEQRQKKTGMPMLLFYKNYLDPACGRMNRMLHEGPIDDLISGKMVRCVLVTDYDPDRAYVAQYGVDRAPALLVIHPDGTYHARVGPLQEQEALEFLRQAKPPGQTPVVNPYLPRPLEYRWHSSLDDASQEAQRLGRPVLIVFKWWLGREDWKLMEYFDAPEVHRLVAQHVHCRLDYDYPPNRRHLASFGLSHTPSVVIVHPDGTYHALEGWVPLEDFVRFLRGARPPGKPRPG